MVLERTAGGSDVKEVHRDLAALALTTAHGIVSTLAYMDALGADLGQRVDGMLDADVATRRATTVG